MGRGESGRLGACLVRRLAGFCLAAGHLLERVPPLPGAAVCAVLFALTRKIDEGLILGAAVMPEWLYRNDFTAFLGFPPHSFSSTDYFSLLPWIFLFWVGWFLFPLWKDKAVLRRGAVRPLMFLGRHSLFLYLIHQPVLYGVLCAAAYLKP